MKIRHTELDVWSYVARENHTMQNQYVLMRRNLTSGEELNIQTCLFYTCSRCRKFILRMQCMPIFYFTHAGDVDDAQLKYEAVYLTDDACSRLTNNYDMLSSVTKLFMQLISIFILRLQQTNDVLRYVIHGYEIADVDDIELLCYVCSLLNRCFFRHVQVCQRQLRQCSYKINDVSTYRKIYLSCFLQRVLMQTAICRKHKLTKYILIYK